MPEAQKVATYIHIYELALAIPVISVLGVILGGWSKWRRLRQLRLQGFSANEAHDLAFGAVEKTPANWWILGGSLVFVVFTVSMGLGDVPYNKEIIFLGSMAIVLFLMSRLVRVLDEDRARQLGLNVLMQASF